LSVHLVNPSDNSFGTAVKVMTARWRYVLAAVKPILHFGRGPVSSTSGSCSRLLFISRLVVVLAGLLTVLMPLTESMSTWDRFLRGGPDLEFGLLGILVSIGLIILIAHRITVSPFFLRMIVDRVETSPALLRVSSAGQFAPAVKDIRNGAEHGFHTGLSLSITPLRI
jgi:hypothetical protein